MKTSPNVKRFAKYQSVIKALQMRNAFRKADIYQLINHERAAFSRAENLTQSILAKAFRGELVPTEAKTARREGRSYEPASALPARIKSKRESKGKSERNAV